SADQSKDLKLVFRKGEGRALTFNILEGGEAYDIGALEFVFEVFAVDGSTAVIELTEDSGGGIINGGVTGVLTIDMSDDDVDLDAKSYHWKLRVISPQKMTWFNGLFVINDVPQDTVEEDGATVEVDLGDVIVSVELTVSEKPAKVLVA